MEGSCDKDLNGQRITYKPQKWARACPVKAGNLTGGMGTTPLQQKLEKKGPFIFSSSRPSVLPCKFSTVAEHWTLEADSLRSSSSGAAPTLKGPRTGGQQGTRGEGADPEACPFHLLPSSGPQILNSQLWPGPADLSMLARDRMNRGGVLVCLQGLQSYGVHLEVLGAEVGLVVSRIQWESWRRVAPVLFVPPSSSA